MTQTPKVTVNEKPRTLLSHERRAQLAADLELGCGNFLHAAVRINPEADAPLFFMDEPARTVAGRSYASFSLNSLREAVDATAAWYFGAGIREKDLVAVYVGEGVENLIHYLALNAIGAIPSLINGNMRPEYAAGFVRKIGAIALFTDREHEANIVSHLAAHDLRFVATVESAAEFPNPRLPGVYPYHHVELDPVLVGHSSGTTGIPKAVVFLHQQFFHGIRYRLGLPHPEGADRLLSALPHSHSAGIAYVMLATLAGTPVRILSSNRAPHVLAQIEAFQPSMVVAFPETFVGLTEEDFGNYDLSSLRIWMNGGDAAHETHIRKLVAVGHRLREERRIPGSVFIDGLGSSEMGFSLFRMIHTPETASYDRCIGQPLEWVDAAILDENGAKLPPHRIGRLGVRAPSVTHGYWNDSVLSARSRIQGYWLTGDLFYRDEQNRFFHVDRTPDAIPTDAGVLYSLQTEELLMKHDPTIIDCTVIGVPGKAEAPVALGLVRMSESITEPETALRARFNTILAAQGKPGLAAVRRVKANEIPLGPTGKVLKAELRAKYRAEPLASAEFA